MLPWPGTDVSHCTCYNCFVKPNTTTLIGWICFKIQKDNNIVYNIALANRAFWLANTLDSFARGLHADYADVNLLSLQVLLLSNFFSWMLLFSKHYSYFLFFCLILVAFDELFHSARVSVLLDHSIVNWPLGETSARRKDCIVHKYKLIFLTFSLRSQSSVHELILPNNETDRDHF